MGEIVNLNQYRKKREKEEKNRRGAENRARSGRRKGDRMGARFEADQREADLDGKRLEHKPSDEPNSG